MHSRRSWVVAAAAGAATLVLASCGSSPSSSGTSSAGNAAAPPKIAMPSSLGAAEGQLNIIAWAGYAEDGSNDKTVDWVHPFEQQTGCKVNVKIGNTSDEMVQLMKTGQYDGVSASGDATLRLIYGGDVAPVARHQGPVLADVEATRCRGSPVEAAEREHQRVLGGLHQGGAGVRVRH